MKTTVTVLALGILLGGCLTSVRRTLPDTVRTVAITRFQNVTDQEILPGLFDEDLRQAFRLDGRVAVTEDAGAADAVLDGSVITYSRQPARFDARNVVQEYQIRIDVELRLAPRGSSDTLWADRGAPSVRGTAAPDAPKGPAVRRLEQDTNFVVVPASGLPVETEEDAQRRIVRDLADAIVIRVLEGW